MILQRKLIWNNQEIEFIKDLHLLTLKPFIFVFNISNDKTKNKLFDHINHEIKSVALNLQFEAELSEINDDEAKEFKKESHLGDLIKSAYEFLDLITFFTIISEETRAWTVKAGSTASEAGAAIHTDFKEKFIRAEVISWQKLLECGSWTKAREKGILRTEGKKYVVSDGDVIEFKI